MAVTQVYALEHYWYWTYWWLDILMHGVGGVVIGLLVTLFMTRRLWLIVALTLLVGMVWEVFEVSIGISISEPNFLFDSTVDLVMDLLGGAAAYAIIRQWERLLLRLTAAHDASPGQTSL